MTAMLHWSKQQRTEGMRIQGMVSKTTNKHFYCTIAKKSYINQHLFTSSIAKRTLYSVNGQCSKTTGKLVNRMPDYSELNEWMNGCDYNDAITDKLLQRQQEMEVVVETTGALEHVQISCIFQLQPDDHQHHINPQFLQAGLTTLPTAAPTNSVPALEAIYH